MYVAVKGGERAIEASWRLLDEARRGDTCVAELSVRQIREQLRLAVARVMTEGSVYDEELAALAIKQAAGDLVEAIFLLRAWRTTVPRFGYTLPIETEAMQIERRISATFKDVPGGQLLGATYDYTQRLLDFALLAEGSDEDGNAVHATDAPQDACTPLESTNERHAPAATSMPRVVALLDREGLIEQEVPSPAGREPGDLTREPLAFPADRATRLQNLARGDEGFLLAMGYATQRGYANSHPFAGEIRFGSVDVEMVLDELGEAVVIGEIDVTECQMVNQFAGSKEVPPTFTQGYGLTFGHAERKAMAMALVDRALRADELGEPIESPTQDVEFLLSHSDNVEASGFVQHLKLPHYVDFQSELELVRRLRAEHRAQRDAQRNEAPTAANVASSESEHEEDKEQAHERA
ncbi:carbon-phosphorus lyase complex subunit PhnI [Paraburkholderia kururiensis]|uniref:Carbon-phosphorus lyase complex subunit PhnI n=1 Tax=Paraburkholderia kururiensis TaxID=984307 RepID=A0ABZ0WPZ4_9BURK|nr:carbon-phosphorus lyase complex subunit PhnI [Paraburkholderia kururiensis]WQD79354.1 carbon-phosphorus lyase complex subunit PhnI [Paraburkholderia kururiensis]